MPPDKFVKINIDLITKELKQLGISYDWSCVKVTSNPEYYKWTQWIFLELYKAGLVYRKEVDLPWCASCKTTLSEMQIKAGRCWRCDGEIKLKPVSQWFIQLSKYSKRLHSSLRDLDQWGSRIKNMVSGFLGEKKGYLIDAAIQVKGKIVSIEVFLPAENNLNKITHVSGCIYHPAIIEAIKASHGKNGVISSEQYLTKINIFREHIKQVPIPRMSRDKIGHTFKTGLVISVAINDTVSLALPLYVTSSLSMDYGPPATFGLHLYDSQDTYKSPYLANKTVISYPANIRSSSNNIFSNKKTYFQVHDWPVSRQRKWGTPIPFIHCLKCGCVPYPKNFLPLLTTWHSDNKTQGYKSNPEKNKKLKETYCFNCGAAAMNDPDTLDCYFDDMWCFLSTVVDLNKGIPRLSQQRLDWLPVDAYHGGFDIHMYLHLYRFFGHVMNDMNHIQLPELVVCHKGHDMVVKNGKKMSTHHGNADPIDCLVKRYGADVLRLAITVAGAPEKQIHWDYSYIERSQSILRKISAILSFCVSDKKEDISHSSFIDMSMKKKLLRNLDDTLLEMKGFYGDYKPHAAIQSGMKMIKKLNQACNKYTFTRNDCDFISNCLCDLILAFSPVIPHFSEEVWASLKQEGLVANMRWPSPL